MYTLELRRFDLPKVFYGNILETRQTSLEDLNQYFIQEFGPDTNGGINTALAYVTNTYGGGRYQLRISRDGKYLQSQSFETSGLPKRLSSSSYPSWEAMMGRDAGFHEILIKKELTSARLYLLGQQDFGALSIKRDSYELRCTWILEFYTPKYLFTKGREDGRNVHGIISGPGHASATPEFNLQIAKLISEIDIAPLAIIFNHLENAFSNTEVFLSVRAYWSDLFRQVLAV